MLHIVTDSTNSNWFQYILDEFKRINLAKFEIQIHSVHENIRVKEPTLFYTNSYSPGVCIPNCSSILPNGVTENAGTQRFILKGSSVGDQRFTFNYDVFWNAFVFLSRLEEFQTEDSGKKISSYSFNHPRREKTTFEIPIVNYLFNDLEVLIKENFPELEFGSKQKLNIELSHDIDYIKKTWQLRVKQTAFNFFNVLRSIKNPIQALKLARKTLIFLFSSPSYWCFDYWRNIEKKYNKRSVFYTYVNLPKSNLKNWLIDPSYEIKGNTAFQLKLKQLVNEGFEIGLHGSYGSATEEPLLKKEKEVLEEIMGIDVTKVRQHWLKYEEKKTPYLHNQHFKYDSSLGWNDRMGFRSGTASQYRPYNHEAQKPFNFLVTPQVVMDSHLFDYGLNRAEFHMQKALSILTEVKKIKSPFVSFSWHQRGASKDYEWHHVYEELLKEIELHS
jgi:hypothetical protein